MPLGGIFRLLLRSGITTVFVGTPIFKGMQMQTDTTNEQMGISEAATKLGLDTTMVRRLCRRGLLGYTYPRLGRVWIVTFGEITTYLSTPRRRRGRPKKTT